MELIIITCTYFKGSGKYYTDGTECFPVSIFKDCIYPRDYGERLRDLRKLPGLESGYWPDYFTVTVKYTELVIPVEEQP